MNFKCKIAGPELLTCKNLGVAIFSFCLGMALGLFFPPQFIALIETALLLALGFLCIFKW